MKIARMFVMLAVIGGLGLFVFKVVDRTAAPPIYTASVTRGDVSLVVQATGTIQATRTVDVGTQVSGTVKRMLVDYNSIVKKGDIIAEIDPQRSEDALQSAQAAVDKAKIDVQSARDTLETDTRARDREEDLFTHDLANEQDRETADVQVNSDQAQVEQAEANVVVAQAGVEQARTTLAFCTIRSPIDGVVVSRNADQGQTVTASLSVPSLYVIATDINDLQLLAQVDEADIGTLHPGQDVTFHVDTYPAEIFHGTMSQVRLSATSSNNVVTYEAVVSVKNPRLRLLPSMTARVDIDVADATNVLRVPNAALRFRPTHAMFEALGQVPVEPPSPFLGVPASLKLPPLPLPSKMPIVADASGHPGIDTLYGPTPHPRSAGSVWVLDAGQLRVVPVVVGVTDGTWSELITGSLQAGETLVTMVTTPASATAPGRSPFQQQRGGYGRYR